MKYESWELVVRSLGKILSNLDPLGISETALTCFDSCESPNISFYDYVARIHKYFYCSDACFVVAFIYIDRALQNNASLILTNLNIHRLTLAAVVLAIKYLEDLYSRNIIYAKTGGICVAELNVLESSFLSMLDFNLYVSPQMYFLYMEELLLESVKTNEELEAMNDCCTKGLKPLRQVGSTESIKTTFSFNEMEEV